jgi:hypothetical protein
MAQPSPGRKEEKMSKAFEDDKEVIKETIEFKLRRKSIIVEDVEQTDRKFLAALIDVCTLNKLRDANK